MKHQYENGKLTVWLTGRVDTTVAPAIGEEIDKIIEQCGGISDFILDLCELVYISSAGLRVVLRLRQKHDTLRIINASSDIYEIFEMTGFSEMIPIEKAFRNLSVDGCEIIGKGAKGTVYRYDEDIIVKVYNRADSLPDIKNERELARRAFVLGIPTAISYDIVRVGDKYGSVFELLSASSYSQMIRDDVENRDRYIDEYADLLRRIHSTNVNPNDMPPIKTFIDQWLAADEPALDDETNKKLRALVDGVSEPHTMLHCDYHTNNVMRQNGETLLIDMDTLSYGHPIFELANVYITYIGFGEVDKTVVEQFMNMPYDLTKYIWDRFLPRYLGTNDPEKIRTTEEKVRLMSYVRLLRHTLRRGEDSDTAKAVIALCQKQIPDLLTRVTTLEF